LKKAERADVRTWSRENDSIKFGRRGTFFKMVTWYVSR
jgi:hypothetical protein